MFVLACAALPFISLFPLSTYLFIALGVGLVFSGNLSFDFNKKNFLPWLFAAFYALQVAGFIAKPHNAHNLFSLEQKASLLFIPLLVSSLFRYDEVICKNGIKGFIAGNLAVCLYCFFYALYQYVQNPNAQYFFYHTYVSPIHGSAIYASLYIMVSILYLLHFYTAEKWQIPFGVLLSMLILFLATLFLLSSKMIIVCGSLLIMLFLLNTSDKKLRLFVAISLLISIGLTVFTSNPVKTRFEEWDKEKHKEVLIRNDFTDYPFDDFDLRLLLARLGYELTNENNAWLFGNGGRSYHEPLSEKMLSYHLFSGNEITKDTGYLDYNMHNQYLENFMQYGLIGFLILLTIFMCCVSSAIKAGSKIMLYISALFFFSFLSESVLETQSGILLFTLIIYYGWKSTKQLTSRYQNS